MSGHAAAAACTYHAHPEHNLKRHALIADALPAPVPMLHYVPPSGDFDIGGCVLLTRLEHFLVMTHDVDATRDFYRDVLGFQEGHRPELGFLGHWLYLGDIPVIHIAEWASYTSHSERLGIPVTRPALGTGPLDHVAFNGSDANYPVLRERLDSLGLIYHPHDSPAVGLRQIFLDDPNGLKLELNFWAGR